MSELVIEAGNDAYAKAAKLVACGVAGAVLVGGVMADCGKQSGGGGKSSGSSSWKVTGGHKKPKGDWPWVNGFDAPPILTGAIAGTVAIETIPDAANIEGLLSEHTLTRSAPLTSLVEKRPGFQE